MCYSLLGIVKKISQEQVSIKKIYYRSITKYFFIICLICALSSCAIDRYKILKPIYSTSCQNEMSDISLEDGEEVSPEEIIDVYPEKENKYQVSDLVGTWYEVFVTAPSLHISAEDHTERVATLCGAGVSETDIDFAADAEEVASDEDVGSVGIEVLRCLCDAAGRSAAGAFVRKESCLRTVYCEIEEWHNLSAVEIVEPRPGDVTQIDEYAVIRRKFGVVGKSRAFVSARH